MKVAFTKQYDLIEDIDDLALPELTPDGAGTVRITHTLIHHSGTGFVPLDSCCGSVYALAFPKNSRFPTKTPQGESATRRLSLW